MVNLIESTKRHEVDECNDRKLRFSVKAYIMTHGLKVISFALEAQLLDYKIKAFLSRILRLDCV